MAESRIGAVLSVIGRPKKTFIRKKRPTKYSGRISFTFNEEYHQSKFKRQM